MRVGLISFGDFVVVRAVVESIAVAVPEKRAIGTGVAFPRFIRHKRHVPTLGLVHVQMRATPQLIDQMIVNEQFEPGPDLNGLFGVSRRGQEYRDNAQDGACHKR